MPVHTVADIPWQPLLLLLLLLLPRPQVTPARKETYHSWDKLWTLNRRLLDPRASRHMAVEDKGRVLLTITGEDMYKEQ
jgi:hypothetical protein